MSRLQSFGEKLIEACWLAAITMAPLFFNVYSSRVFEPDKTSLVRTLALVMVAAWLAIRAEALSMGSSPRPRGQTSAPLGNRLRSLADSWSRQNPLTLPTLGLIVIYIISTLASVSPSISLLGSYVRMQGTYTTFSYIVIFFLTASTIRTRAQVDRAITVACLVSFPVAFYGIVQHYFLDPLPWGGDTTTRVAANMGNPIFVGAYLIMALPLALGRLIEHSGNAAEQFESKRDRALLYGGVIGSILLLAAAWGLSFELGAKKLIEGHIQDKLTPEMLAATSANFSFALAVTVVVVLGWWLAGVFLKKRVGPFLLVALYGVILSFQGLTLLFTQSRGPLLGFLGGMFTFALLYALIRGARRIALGAMAAALLMFVLLAVLNFSANTPLAGLRDLPYVGRLGHVFETQDGTGRVRVLIWQGALQLTLPHAPLWSPATGNDPLNPIRPLIGYGPETLAVTYNNFYPPELGHLESRNAAPDRAHNETFDALTSTGLIGFLAENMLFLSVFYFGLKWLGLVKSSRERNTLIALWYASGALVALGFGASLGWEYIGVGLPAGMILGLFLYLIGVTWFRGSELRWDGDPWRALFLIMFLAVIVSHFIEIHFGIAIVSTRTYFWFLAALMVVVGARLATEASVPEVASRPVAEATEVAPAARPRRRKAGRATGASPAPRRANSPANGAPRVLSSTPLIAMAFLGGLLMATMGFDYITTTNMRITPGQSVFGLDIIISSLVTKSTTAGVQVSYAMFWLFVGAFGLMLGIALLEWGWKVSLPVREWLLAAGLFSALVLAIMGSFLLYHTLLIGTSGAGIYDAVFATVTLFVVFMLVMVAVIAVTLQMDERPIPLLVHRATNWIVAPALVVFALLLVFATNVSSVQADMIYKQAAAEAGGSTLADSIALYQRALSLQPNQDYYLLFLGSTYLQYARSLQDEGERLKALNDAESVLLQARQLNPLNTDHSANLARLHEAWAVLVSDPGQQEAQYKKTLDYYNDALRLSPNTAHLYDQLAQAELDYASTLDSHNNAAAATETRHQAQAILDRSFRIDPTFCLTVGVRGETQSDWNAMVTDGLQALKLSADCGDTFTAQGRSVAVQVLSTAGDRAAAQGQGAQFAARVEEAARTQPSVEIYTALLNYYSKAGEIDSALRSTDAAIALISTSDSATLKQYQDFRANLVNLQQALAAVKSAPGNAVAHRKLADLWLARGQQNLALPEYQQVAQLLPQDYDSHRRVTLLLVQQNKLSDATRMLTPTMELAPADQRPMWQELGQVLDSAQKGENQAALTTLNNLLQTVDQKDTSLLDALHALADKLKASS